LCALDRGVVCDAGYARAGAAMKPIEQVAIAVERARRRSGNICDSVSLHDFT
jgi:hypothetical protein